MQLKRKRRGRISRALGLITANLLAAAGAHAQVADGQGANATIDGGGVNDDTRTDLGLTRVDSAVLFYQEAGGRVKTTEPVVNVAFNGSGGDVVSIKLTADILTGATPNGAAPWTGSQTFVTPAHPPGSTATVTNSSGGSTLVTIPGTGVVARQYVIGPNQLPVDAGFRDERYAVDVGYSTLWDADTRLSGGLSASTERDYSSYSANIGGSRDLNHKNTTLSLAFDFEYDLSRPYFGTPTPFTVMSADAKGPNQSKLVYSLVAGVTQVINRYWLAQLNYSVGSTDGYQTDPYRIISVVDPSSGAPLSYLYENRPRTRLRQSVYFGNKIALGPTFLDVSGRYYRDSWGINSFTGAISDRIPVLRGVYFEPEGRYYTQTAANFFQNYLISGQSLPAYASSDSRLGKFDAVTLGGKVGVKVNHMGELYVQAEYYRQMGAAHPAGVISGLAGENLFTGITATSVLVGYTFAFY